MAWGGVYKGIVTNDSDPEGYHRIKALVPQVFGNHTTESEWAWPCVPPGWFSQHAVSPITVPSQTVQTEEATPATVVIPAQTVNPTLSQIVPRAGQGVWIMFEGGDEDHPVWLGVWRV